MQTVSGSSLMQSIITERQPCPTPRHVYGHGAPRFCARLIPSLYLVWTRCLTPDHSYTHVNFAACRRGSHFISSQIVRLHGSSDVEVQIVQPDYQWKSNAPIIMLALKSDNVVNEEVQLWWDTRAPIRRWCGNQPFFSPGSSQMWCRCGSLGLRRIAKIQEAELGLAFRQPVLAIQRR